MEYRHLEHLCAVGHQGLRCFQVPSGRKTLSFLAGFSDELVLLGVAGALATEKALARNLGQSRLRRRGNAASLHRGLAGLTNLDPATVRSFARALSAAESFSSKKVFGCPSNLDC